ncbi:unnamed protein product [Tenebrio molitor]|nr:unnamed protein product [Tenebrio molitor]
MAMDQYVTIQRDRFSQMTRELDEVWQIDIVYGLVRKKIRDRVSRTDIETFEDLLENARVIKANERDTGCSDKTLDETQKTRSRCSFCKIGSQNNMNGAERPAVKIVIGGVPGTAYLDSGGKVSLASPKLYKVLKNQEYRFKKVPINLI